MYSKKKIKLSAYLPTNDFPALTRRELRDNVHDQLR